MFTGNLEELYRNYVGSVLVGPSRGSEGNLSELDGARPDTGRARYNRSESFSPSPLPSKIKKSARTPPQLGRLDPNVNNHNFIRLPSQTMKRPNSTGVDSDSSKTAQNRFITNTASPSERGHVVDASSASSDISKAESFHERFWASKAGRRRESAKSFRVLGLSTTNIESLPRPAKWPTPVERVGRSSLVWLLKPFRKVDVGKKF
ncbi:hypothetical protein FKW77_000450 [Venturia effusa]|uniref:Uncharacterized protein n=1 Tax=Venturia effusa TaxID=50376 RepID=A0A517LA83_9PEZI|nr:hypothetical protein FKW77_000450 [Venturia effusa]